MLPSLALPLALGVFPQTGAASRVAASAVVAPRVFSGATSTGVGVLGVLAVEAYPLRAVRDDDAPLDLQPFLQRVSSLTLTAHGSLDRIDNVTRVHASDRGLGLRADFTLGDIVVLGASAAWNARTVEYATVSSDMAPGEPYPLTCSFTLGARVGDLRVEASYDASTRAPGDFSLSRDRVTVRARAVFARRLDVAAEVYASEPGERFTERVGGALSAGWFVTRRLGLIGRLALAPRSVWTGSDRTDFSLGAGLEASWWPWESGRVLVGYGAVAEWQPGEYFVRHAWQLGFAWRFGR